jgi:arylsulfatase A-like enzyme
VAALLAALLAGAAACGRSDRPPDVVLIVVDTLRWDRLPLAGYPRPVAPRLAAFAAESVVFEEARAVASWTRPTVASILTGYSPRRHGALRYDEGLAAVPTLATRLGLAGYATRALVANNFLHEAGFERGFQQFDHLSLRRNWHVPGAEVTRAALAAVPEAADAPLFLYVHYLDPHDPYRPDPHARRTLVRPYDGPVEGSMAFVRGRLLRGLHAVTDEDVRFLSDLYDAEIRSFDDALGALLDGLRDAGRYHDAWIVLTADHGEELHDRGGWLHSYTLYEEQLHVPLIVKPPRGLGVEPGRRRGLTSQLDVVPTLLDGLGLDPDAADGPAIEGRSLLPVLRDPDVPLPDRILFAEQGFGRQEGRVGFGYSARRGALKWIEVDGEYSHHATPPGGECYDLEADPGERRNLARPDGAHPCAALAAAVNAWRRGARAEGVPLDLSQETEERLRALGYTP